MILSLSAGPRGQIHSLCSFIWGKTSACKPLLCWSRHSEWESKLSLYFFLVEKPR